MTNANLCCFSPQSSPFLLKVKHDIDICLGHCFFFFFCLGNSVHQDLGFLEFIFMIRDWNWKPQEINWGHIILTSAMWISSLYRMLGSKCLASLLPNSVSLLFPALAPFREKSPSLLQSLLVPLDLCQQQWLNHFPSEISVFHLFYGGEGRQKHTAWLKLHGYFSSHGRTPGVSLPGRTDWL